MAGRLAKAGFAIAALVALVGGVPAVLATTVGNPLHARDDLIAGDVTNEVFIALVAAVVWVAWAQFLISVAAEVVASIRQVGRPKRIVLVPAYNRHLAHALVASALLIGTAAVAGSATVQAAAGVPVTTSRQATSQTRTHEVQAVPVIDEVRARPGIAAPASVATVSYVVPADGRGPDTYWDIAEAHLGTGSLWREVWDVNHGRTQSDGTVMNDPGLLRPGWTVFVPVIADAGRADNDDDRAVESRTTNSITVRPGDTLSGIAESHGVADWRDVWDESEGIVEPDGERFTDPDFVLPGWTVHVPKIDGSKPPPAATADAADSNRREPQPAKPTAPPAPSEPTPSITPPTTGLPAAPSTAPATPSTAVTLSPSAGASQASDGVTRQSQNSSDQFPAFAGGGSLLAAIALGALLRHRRRQFRWRRPGRMIAVTPPGLMDFERQLSAAGSSAAADVTWLDQALRSLTHSLTEGDVERLPDVVAVRMTRECIQLVLTSAHSDPPVPWMADEQATRWTVRRGDALAYDSAARPFQVAPFPTLVSVGFTREGEYWLLDLERVAALSLSGDEVRCLDLARFIAAELANNPWSEMLQVTLVGFGSELIEVNPDRLTYSDDINEALDSLDQQLTPGDPDEGHAVDVLGDRAGTTGRDAVPLHVVLVAPHLSADRERLNRLFSRLREHPGRASVALVLSEQSDDALGTRWELTLDQDGNLRVPALSLDLLAQRLSEKEALDLAALLAAAASTDDRAMPAAVAAQPGDGHTDVAGASLEDTADANSRPPSDLTAMRMKATFVDPTLDDDLAAWRDPASSRPKISLLGPVHVEAHGALPSQSPRLAWNTEVVAYLAMHPEGVSAERFGTDLWPDDPNIQGKTKVRQAILVARKWLGVGEDGREYLPKGTTSLATDGVAKYEIVDALVDAELFRRLRVRGEARGLDGIDDLWSALDLVTGQPFDGRRPGGYSWLAESALDHVYAAMIADTSHAVATHELNAGDAVRATEAAQVALRAGSSEDTPLLDLLASSDAAGTWAESEELVRRIMHNHEAEVEEDLPPRTYAQLIRRQQQ